MTDSRITLGIILVTIACCCCVTAETNVQDAAEYSPHLTDIDTDNYEHDDEEMLYRRQVATWSQWTDSKCTITCDVSNPNCNTTCGDGNIRRSRTCSSGVNRQCETPGETWWSIKSCHIPCVKAWTEWTATSDCSKSCDQGFVQRTRNCTTGNVLDCLPLSGKWWEVHVCNNGPCAAYGEWQAWSSCSMTCGPGTSARFRTCSTGKNSDCLPIGPYYQIDGCTLVQCPTTASQTTTTTTTTTTAPAVWSEWSERVKCSKTCGGGFHERVRTCSTGVLKDCPGGRYWSIDVCNTQTCAVDGAWSDWSTWSQCPVTCASGSQFRSRSCVYPDLDNKGLPCAGDANETKTCDQGLCPVDGQWGAWSIYSSCSKTCDEGQKSRNRSCVFPDNTPKGANCAGAATDTQKCTLQVCKGDGFWEDWSSYSQCTKSCGKGQKFRARLCSYPPNRPQGEPCAGKDFEADTCNTGLCPVNGTWTSWSSWTQCSHSCNGGLQQRNRQCTFPPGAPHLMDCPGNRTEAIQCGLEECPVDGEWSTWAPWLTCSSTCGGGTTTRVRTCDYRSPTAPHGQPCVGEASGQKNCSTNLCPVDATWSLWSAFTSCSVTCGGGTRTQTRTCQYDPVAPLGLNCTGSTEKSRPCNSNQCPVDGRYLDWSAWSTCTVSCETGTHSRTRQCYFAPNVPHGDDCQGSAREDDACNIFQCPTTTPATTTTTLATVDGHWDDWTDWSDCTHTCGGGTALRKRICTYPDHTLHGQYCPGPSNQTQDCNTDNCPVDGHWSSWGLFGRCSVSCGNGTNTRTRTCEFDQSSPHGDDCTGADSEDGPCNAGPCPVDGVFSPWSTWNTCSVTCGGGLQGRQRTCDYPANMPHGSPCQGNTHENQTCNSNLCPVDGVFTDWTQWTSCPVTCGNGTQTRNRTCSFKDGYPHGLDCVGEIDQLQFCNTNLCPVDGHYSNWKAWDPCPISCGGGIQIRNRDCIYDPVAPHGAACPGSPSETQLCGLNPCPVDGHWTAWSTWTACSTTCANGTSSRVRSCTYIDTAPHGNPCPGDENDSQTCDEGPCPVDGVWSDWAAWSKCTVTCGNGTSTRDRTCDFPDNLPHGENCTGPEQESQECGTNLCPIDGHFGVWGTWTSCTVTCGGGSQIRNRPCEYDLVAPHGDDCIGAVNQTYNCSIEHCPVDGVWTTWGDFTACSVTCGGGTQDRTRQCHFEVGSPHGNDCPGNASDSQTCNNNLCPVDGTFTDWSNWTTCTLSCGNGTQMRDRTCTFPDGVPHGDDCSGDFNQTQACNVDLCPINGKWSDWSAYSPCTTSCANGTHTRNRTCIFDDNAPHGSACFGPTNETSTCNPTPCPVDGVWSVWTSWDQCTTTCGGGKQGRVRTCDYPDNIPHGTDCTGSPSELQDCNKNLCPVDGKISEWVSWTPCSLTCGNGIMYRSRKCEYPDNVPHGANCTELLTESNSCEIQLCPVDGRWGSWSSWDTCTVTCAGGTRVRNRTCEFTDGFPHGENCTGNTDQSENCNEDPCPVDGVWSAWGDFSPCTKSCGNGTSTRSRSCEYTPSSAPHGTACPGPQTDVITCNDTECPQDAVWSDWNQWSDCSVTCESGSQTRNRTCDWPTAVHGSYCMGNTSDIQVCKLGLCPVDGVWTSWGNWSDCSTTCDRGQQVRQRTCEFDALAPQGSPCQGSPQETRNCNEQNLCAVDGQWAPWTSFGVCSTTCGDGVVTRTRNCVFLPATAPHGANCTGADSENSPCNGTTPCPVDGQWDVWTSWTTCSVTCGSGQQSRTRNCVFDDTKPHGHDCFGPGSENQTCSDGVCPVDGDWGAWKSWSACDASCGGGTRTRDRDCDFPANVPHGKDCHGQSDDHESCHNEQCPVDGHWGPWKSWGSCDVSCGGGTQTRHRECKFPSHVPHGTFCTGPSIDDQNCNTNLCAVDGVWSAWGDFSACTKSCGNGTSTRTRTCEYSPPTAPHGTACPGSETNVIACNDTECPQDAIWTDWSTWSDCSVTCEDGIQTRNRTCNWPTAVHGSYCTGNTSDNKVCTLGLCPVDGVPSDWNPWSSCTKSCATGTHSRTRTCEFLPANAPHGNDCTEALSETADCNTQLCPRKCQICDPNYPDYCADLTVEEECSEDKRYCINQVDNAQNGDAVVTRRCGTEQDCTTGLVQQSNTDDDCLNYNPQFIFTNQFTCGYCCNATDNCNQDVVVYQNKP